MMESIETSVEALAASFGKHTDIEALHLSSSNGNPSGDGSLPESNAENLVESLVNGNKEQAMDTSSNDEAQLDSSTEACSSLADALEKSAAAISESSVADSNEIIMDMLTAVAEGADQAVSVLSNVSSPPIPPMSNDVSKSVMVASAQENPLVADIDELLASNSGAQKIVKVKNEAASADQSNVPDSNISEPQTKENADPFSLFSVCGNCKSSMLDEKDLSKIPKLLPCLHIYCLSCIEASLTDANPLCDSFVRCPSEQCGITFRMSDTGDTRFMQALAAKQANKSTSVSGTIKICSSCDENQDATSFCVVCREYLCDECVTAHKRVRVTKDHTIQLISEANIGVTPEDPVVTCKMHPQEELQLYCETCEMLTCRDCQLLQHKDHKYQFVKEACELYKVNLGSLLSKLTDKSEIIEKWQNVIEDRMTEINSKQTEIIDSIKNMGAELIDAINMRCRELAQQIHSICKVKKEQLQLRNTEIHQLKSRIIRALRMGNMVVAHSNAGLVLEGKRLFLNHLNNALIARCEVPNPMHKLDIKFVNQNQNLVHMMAQIGYLCVNGLPYGSSAPGSSRPVRGMPSSLKVMSQPSWYPSERAPSLNMPPNVSGLPPSYQTQSRQMPNLHKSQPTMPNPQAGNPQRYNGPQMQMQQMMQMQQHQQHQHQHQQQKAFLHQMGVQVPQQSPPNQSSTISSSQQKYNGFRPPSSPVLNSNLNSIQHLITMAKTGNGPNDIEYQRRHAEMTKYNQRLSQLHGSTIVIDNQQSSPGVSSSPHTTLPSPSASNGSKFSPDTQTSSNPAGGAMFENYSTNDLEVLSVKRPRRGNDKAPPVDERPSCNYSREMRLDERGVPFGSRPISEKDRDKEAAEVSAIAKLLEDDGSRKERQKENNYNGTLGSIIPGPVGSISSAFSPVKESKSKGQRLQSSVDPNEDWCACCHNGGDVLCCDTCPKVFHLKCHIPELTTTPSDSKWSCGLCLASQDDILSDADGSSITARTKKTLNRILLELYTHESSQHLHEPIDEKEMPNYYKLVKNPMFFSTIRRKLALDEYSDIFAFLHDIKLIISNCRKHLHMMQPDVIRDYKILDEVFEDLVAKLLPSMYKHLDSSLAKLSTKLQESRKRPFEYDQGVDVRPKSRAPRISDSDEEEVSPKRVKSVDGGSITKHQNNNIEKPSESLPNCDSLTFPHIGD